MNFDFSFLWLIVAAVALIGSLAIVLRNWTTYSLPLKLIPVDVLTVVLLIDLNLKSNSNITNNDMAVRIEGIAFTALLVFVLFAPVVWKFIFGGKGTSSRKDEHQS